MDWLNVWRTVNAVLCALSIILLVLRFCQFHRGWNTKTRDIWFSSLMWSAAGCEGMIEGIIRNTEFGYRLVFVTAAALVSVKTLLQKGRFGGEG